MNKQRATKHASDDVSFDRSDFIMINVLSVTSVNEITLSDNPPVEIKLHVICLSPVNEVDTFATINRHFDDGENFDYEFTFNESGFVFNGYFIMCEQENIENMKPGEYKIPLSTRIKTLLKNDTYRSLSEPDSIMVDAWFGDRCETKKNSWVKG